MSVPHRLLVLLAGATLLLPALGCKTRELGDAPSTKPVSSKTRRVPTRKLVFSDNFNRPTLGSNWKRGKGEGGKGQWRIEQGWLAGDRIKNDALWMTKPLPERVRVEFDAKSLTDVGDLKFEIFGDGGHHESGYIVIFGGWKNSLDVIARLDEHGADRKAKPSRRVIPNTVHKLAAERDGDTLRWFVDGALVLEYRDPRPLRGPEHRFFAFNNWATPVRFDNLKVYELR